MDVMIKLTDRKVFPGIDNSSRFILVKVDCRARLSDVSSVSLPFSHFYDSHHAGSTFCHLQWWHCAHKCRIRARDRRGNENLHAHRLALLVQRFHRHKFITAPAQSILPVMSSSSPNAVAVDLICSACCCNGDAPHSSIAPNETVHSIPATSATSAIRKIENPVLRMAVSSLFSIAARDRQYLPIKR